MEKEENSKVKAEMKKSDETRRRFKGCIFDEKTLTYDFRSLCILTYLNYILTGKSKNVWPCFALSQYLYKFDILTLVLDFKNVQQFCLILVLVLRKNLKI